VNTDFPNTRWSVIAAAKTGGDAGAVRAALNELCRAYWYPLYAYARRRGLGPEDAEDATQSFFATVLESNLFAAAEPSLGRLRSFLLTAFSRDLADAHRAATRQKRGAGVEVISLDLDDAESRYTTEKATAPPERQFETDWATLVLEAAIHQVEETYTSSGRGPLFLALRPFLGAGDAELPDQAQLAATLNLSPAAFRQSVSRLRDRFRTALRSQIADTLRDPSDEQIDGEIRALRSILAGNVQNTS